MEPQLPLHSALTSTGTGSFGGSSLVSKVRDMFVRAFVRMGEGGLEGAV